MATGTKDRTVQALMGLLDEMKVQALQAGRYGTAGYLGYDRFNPVVGDRVIKEFTGKSFDIRDKKAAHKCMAYQTLVNWTIPHLNKAIDRLMEHPCD